jgi:DNA-directed RNA polymerase specialized sigma24 family protein
MASRGSVTEWAHKLQAGEQEAVQKLWERYFTRLVELARRRLLNTPTAAADEEDAALSAFDSFCRRAAEGRFPPLLDRDGLWHLLVCITCCKVSNQAHREQAGKRGGGRVRHLSALAPPGSSAGEDFAARLGEEPSPEFAAQAAEECQRLLGQLPDPQLRQIAVWKLEGWTSEEIARNLGRSVPTVERKLRRIRELWDKEMPS